VPLHAIVGRNEIGPAAAETIDLRSVTEATDLEQLEAAGERLAAALR
jgi:glycerate kinase